MELRKIIELGGQGFKPWPTYTEDLTSQSPGYWLERTNMALDSFIPFSDTLIMKNPFNKWVECSPSDVLFEAEDFITRFDRLKRSTWIARFVHSMELRLFDTFQMPLLKPQQNKKLFDLFAVEEVRLGDGSAYLDTYTNQWKFTQKHGVYHHPSHFMVVGIGK